MRLNVIHKSAIMGAALTAVCSSAVGAVAWFGDPNQFTWFIGIGEIIAFGFLKGDNYSSYRDMARHGIPIAIAIYTMVGGLVGALVGAVRLRGATEP